MSSGSLEVIISFSSFYLKGQIGRKSKDSNGIFRYPMISVLVCQLNCLFLLSNSLKFPTYAVLDAINCITCAFPIKKKLYIFFLVKNNLFKENPQQKLLLKNEGLRAGLRGTNYKQAFKRVTFIRKVLIKTHPNLYW